MELEGVNEPSEIDVRLTDILFDCPLCGKSMVIDEAAVGMAVDCPQCAAKVIVPELMTVPPREVLPDEALLLAAQTGDLDLLTDALTAGAEVNATDAEGTTALMMAVQRGDENVVAKLIARGANLQVQRPDGQTAMKLAETGNHFRILRMLWRSGSHGVQ